MVRPHFLVQMCFQGICFQSQFVYVCRANHKPNLNHIVHVYVVKVEEITKFKCVTRMQYPASLRFKKNCFSTRDVIHYSGRQFMDLYSRF